MTVSSQVFQRYERFYVIKVEAAADSAPCSNVDPQILAAQEDAVAAWRLTSVRNLVLKTSL